MGGKQEERYWRGEKISIWLFRILSTSPKHSKQLGDYPSAQH